MLDSSSARAGAGLRELRRQRRLSQLELAHRTGVSQRHLSCIETGRAHASRAMLLALLDAMDAPLEERNSALLAAGYAPQYPARSLADQDMIPVREALSHLLSTHEPAPAMVVDSAWNVVQVNDGVRRLAGLLDIPLVTSSGPFNLLRATFAPGGLSTQYVNRDEVCAELWLRAQREALHVPQLRGIMDELKPQVANIDWQRRAPTPLLIARLRSKHGELRFFSSFTTFGCPLDITVESLRVEHLFPADARTRELLVAG